jgi:uncharacterized protein (DUF433 family)
MNLPLEAIAVPLRADGHGGFRVGRSHVQLERIIAAHRQGAAPADIVDMYPTLELADVHAVLAWVLRHPVEVEAYLRWRDEQAADLRRKLVAAGMTRPGLKEELEARRARQGPDDAAPARR